MFDLIIPCLYKHKDNLVSTIESFGHRYLINNIIIVLNDVSEEYELDLCGNVWIIESKKKLKPGKARELGLVISESKYVVFHDADDEAHPDKLLILKYFYEKIDCDHILHLVQPISLDFIKYDCDKIKYIESDRLLEHYNKKKNMEFGDIIKKRISHGLISVKREKIMNIKWSNKRSGEDKDFNRESLLIGNRMILLDSYLSKYDKYSVNSLRIYHKEGYLELCESEKIKK